MAIKYLIVSGTESDIKGVADTLEEAILKRGPVNGSFSNSIYKLIDVAVVEVLSPSTKGKEGRK